MTNVPSTLKKYILNICCVVAIHATENIRTGSLDYMFTNVVLTVLLIAFCKRILQRLGATSSQCRRGRSLNGRSHRHRPR